MTTLNLIQKTSLSWSHALRQTWTTARILPSLSNLPITSSPRCLTGSAHAASISALAHSAIWKRPGLTLAWTSTERLFRSIRRRILDTLQRWRRLKRQVVTNLPILTSPTDFEQQKACCRKNSGIRMCLNRSHLITSMLFKTKTFSFKRHLSSSFVSSLFDHKNS